MNKLIVSTQLIASLLTSSRSGRKNRLSEIRGSTVTIFSYFSRLRFAILKLA